MLCRIGVACSTEVSALGTAEIWGEAGGVSVLLLRLEGLLASLEHNRHLHPPAARQQRRANQACKSGTVSRTHFPNLNEKCH